MTIVYNFELTKLLRNEDPLEDENILGILVFLKENNYLKIDDPEYATDVYISADLPVCSIIRETKRNNPYDDRLESRLRKKLIPVDEDELFVRVIRSYKGTEKRNSFTKLDYFIFSKEFDGKFKKKMEGHYENPNIHPLEFIRQHYPTKVQIFDYLLEDEIN